MTIKDILKQGVRKLELTPMGRVLRELRRRGISLKTLRALELFASSGEGHIKDYAPWVSTLELWEIDPKCERILQQNFPTAKIKITDSYKEVKSTSQSYDLIVVDNGTSIYSEYCEHFELFPDIFRIAGNSCILIVNVIPEVQDADVKYFPYLFNKAQLVRREVFYKTNHPEKVSFHEMLKVYKDLLEANGFQLEWHFVQKRTFIYYLVLKIKRI